MSAFEQVPRSQCIIMAWRNRRAAVKFSKCRMSLKNPRPETLPSDHCGGAIRFFRPDFRCVGANDGWQGGEIQLTDAMRLMIGEAPRFGEAVAPGRAVGLTSAIMMHTSARSLSSPWLTDKVRPFASQVSPTIAEWNLIRKTRYSRAGLIGKSVRRIHARRFQ